MRLSIVHKLGVSALQKARAASKALKVYFFRNKNRRLPPIFRSDSEARIKIHSNAGGCNVREAAALPLPLPHAH